MSFATIVAAGVSTCLVSMTAVHAQEPTETALGTIDGLLSACTYRGTNQAEVEYQFGTCIGFIRGVRVAMETVSLGQGRAFTCPPGGVTDNAELRDAVVAELRRSTQSQLNISVFPVMTALRQLYPCHGNEEPNGRR